MTDLGHRALAFVALGLLVWMVVSASGLTPTLGALHDEEAAESSFDAASDLTVEVEAVELTPGTVARNASGTVIVELGVRAPEEVSVSEFTLSVAGADRLVPVAASNVTCDRECTLEVSERRIAGLVDEPGEYELVISGWWTYDRQFVGRAPVTVDVAKLGGEAGTPTRTGGGTRTATAGPTTEVTPTTTPPRATNTTATNTTATNTTATNTTATNTTATNTTAANATTAAPNGSTPTGTNGSATTNDSTTRNATGTTNGSATTNDTSSVNSTLDSATGTNSTANTTSTNSTATTKNSTASLGGDDLPTPDAGRPSLAGQTGRRTSTSSPVVSLAPTSGSTSSPISTAPVGASTTIPVTRAGPKSTTAVS